MNLKPLTGKLKPCPFFKTVCPFLKMIDPVIPFFSIHPEEMKIYVPTWLVHEYSWSIINNNPKVELIQMAIS